MTSDEQNAQEIHNRRELATKSQRKNRIGKKTSVEEKVLPRNLLIYRPRAKRARKLPSLCNAARVDALENKFITIARLFLRRSHPCFDGCFAFALPSLKRFHDFVNTRERARKEIFAQLNFWRISQDSLSAATMKSSDFLIAHSRNFIRTDSLAQSLNLSFQLPKLRFDERKIVEIFA